MSNSMQDSYRPGPTRDSASAPPKPVRLLLVLTVASGLLYVALGVVTTIIFGSMNFARMYQQMGVPATDTAEIGPMMEQMRGTSIASGVVAVLVVIALYVVAYVFLRKGANWARITCVVLAILSALTFLGNLFGFWLFGEWAVILTVIGIAFILVNIAWVMTAFRAPVRDWFTRPRTPMIAGPSYDPRRG